MKDTPLINEVFWLRCIACIAVTFRHALNNGYVHYTEMSGYHSIVYIMFNFVLFGVPVFVFISEFLLANKYSVRLPKGFIKKRLKILAIPYIFMSIVFAIFEIENWTFRNFFTEVSKNLFLGESTVYFIIIIFQFYILHILFRNHLSRLSPRLVIPIAFIINVIYLSIFNFTNPPDNSIGEYFWNPGYWMPFVGWLFYFVLGFYCGQNYSHVIHFIRKNKFIVLILPVVFFSIILINNKYLLLDQDSKRFDMLLFATSIIFLLLLITSFRRKVPKIVIFVSNYSFSIFLLNDFFYKLLLPISPPDFLNIFTYSSLVFLLSIISSVALSFIFNKFWFGKYLVGNVMKFNSGSISKIVKSA